MRRRPLTNFDMWMVLIILSFGRLAQLGLIAWGIAILFGWYRP